MDPLASAVGLGFVLGVQHATDPDHLVAVATIVTRERRFADGALIGALWGLGHMVALALAGAVIVGFTITLRPRVTTGLELLVAAMLVILGILRLRDAARGVEAVEPEHLAADHDHGGAEVLHSHAHAHGGHVHGHPHVHPSRRLLAAFGAGRRRLAARAVAIGAVHGMAGSAAVSLLVLATLPTVAGAVAYLLVFGVGTIIGMTALTAVMAYPVALASRVRRARTGLAVAAGVGSIAFGIVYAVAAVWTVLGFLAKLLVNERLIRHLLTATVGVADDVRRRSRDADSGRGKAGGDIAARVDALEASMLKEAGMTSMIAAQFEGVAAALQVITFRLAIALALGGLAAVLALVALLVAILR